MLKAVEEPWQAAQTAGLKHGVGKVEDVDSPALTSKSSASRPWRTGSRVGRAVRLDVEVAADVEPCEEVLVEACEEELGDALSGALSSSEEASAAWAGTVALMLMPVKRVKRRAVRR